jgi:O-antigen/teichoic acid export membrane protein
LLGKSLRQSVPLAVVLLGISIIQAARLGDIVWIQLWPLLFVSNLVVALASAASLALNAGERHWGVLTLNGLTSVARALFPVGMVLLLGPTLPSLSLGFALHALVVAMAILALFRGTELGRTTDPLQEAQWRKELRDFGRPFMAMGVAGWLLMYADRWVVDFAFGDEQLGLFTLASNIGSIVPGLVSAGLMQGAFPAVFRQSDQARSPQDWRNLARRCDWFTLLFLGVAVAGLGALQLVGPLLVGWLIGNQYAPSMPLLLPAGMGAVAMQANQFQYLLLQGQHNSAGMLRVMLVLSGMRTIGSIVAGSISWSAFLGWQLISALLIVLLGRLLIQRMALSNSSEPKAGALAGSIRG